MLLSSQQLNKNVVHGIQGFAFVPQQGATAAQDHRPMRPVEAIDVHRHAGFLLREHLPLGKVLLCDGWRGFKDSPL
jgi:hypothetical protein